ncbi:alpha/beta hydrolase [Planctomicrobium piriforme]|uniref:Acetyl esterase/lipase n=1 Tax=Planctomicrobium piriforme TaxID=1576369 RepID=A0A1I3CHF6_9PLAN|nr:alpha/beta hydrolase [Planctomicrobium piriforme]SFH73972.1 Acetyl esterase/lipase [Planctomicrobium piriforme]
MPRYDAASDPAIDHHVQGFLTMLNSGGGKPMEQMTPQQARQVLVDVQKSVKCELPPCEIVERRIMQDGQSVSVTVVRPAGAKGLISVFMFFHGGGWVLGDFPTHERLVRDIVSESGACAVFVNYTPSPEARYPIAIEQAYAATKWVAAHGAEIGVDASRLAVVGNSVGGNMTAVIALKARLENGPKIRFQALMWPVTDANFETPSYHQFAEGRYLTRNMMKWFWDNYTQVPGQRQEIYASPLQASIEQLTGLPPALIQVDENDVLRDEGEAYARKLNAAGVNVVCTRYNGMIHDWGLLNPLATVPATRASIRQVADELKSHLS